MLLLCAVSPDRPVVATLGGFNGGPGGIPDGVYDAAARPNDAGDVGAGVEIEVLPTQLTTAAHGGGARSALHGDNGAAVDSVPSGAGETQRNDSSVAPKGDSVAARAHAVAARAPDL